MVFSINQLEHVMNSENMKAAIVTGGSRGIGRAIAKRLAKDGFGVVVNFAGNVGKAQETVSEIERAAGKAAAVQGDISNPQDVLALFEFAQKTFGRVDVVVNNAGVMPMSLIDPKNLADFDKTIATNLRGAFLVLAQAATAVREGGRIIALSSSVIAKSFPGYGPYIASKAGVEGLVRVLANEMRGRRITVNAVAPGPVDTELFRQGKTAQQIEQITQLAPLARLGTPEDIAAVISFLAGEDGGWVNGQILRANGGFA